MWNATPRGWASWDYDVENDSGGPVGWMRFSFWREQGRAECAEGLFFLSRQPGWGPFEMTRDGVLLAVARKNGYFNPTFEIESGTARWTLRPRSWWGNRWAFLQDGQEVGRIETPFMARNIKLWLPDDMPAPTGLFVVWLMALLRRRAAAAAAH